MKYIAILIAFSIVAFQVNASPTFSDVQKLIRKGDASSIKNFIDDGLDLVGVSEGNNVSILEIAVMFDKPDILELFINSNPKIVEKFGNNALVTACATNKRNPRIISILLDSGVDIDAKNSQGRNCLYRAVISADYDFFHYLVEKGADPNIAISPYKELKIKSPISIRELIELRFNSYQSMRNRITSKVRGTP